MYWEYTVDIPNMEILDSVISKIANFFHAIAR